MVKSAWSQAFIVVGFIGIAWLSTVINNDEWLLKISYWGAMLLSFGYLFYKPIK